MILEYSSLIGNYPTDCQIKPSRDPPPSEDEAPVARRLGLPWHRGAGPGARGAHGRGGGHGGLAEPMAGGGRCRRRPRLLCGGLGAGGGFGGGRRNTAAGSVRDEDAATRGRWGAGGGRRMEREEGDGAGAHSLVGQREKGMDRETVEFSTFCIVKWLAKWNLANRI